MHQSFAYCSVHTHLPVYLAAVKAWHVCHDSALTFRCGHVCRLLQRPASVSGAAAQAGLAAGRAEAAMAPIMEGMPAGLRRIAGQAAQLLTSHVRSLP